jgi:hypothetical protein
MTSPSTSLDRLAAEIDAMIAFGVDGIYSNGTAGEFHTQSEQEFDLISQCLAGNAMPPAGPSRSASATVAQTMLAFVERIIDSPLRHPDHPAGLVSRDRRGGDPLSHQNGRGR